jgi:hypothetical protein
LKVRREHERFCRSIVAFKLSEVFRSEDIAQFLASSVTVSSIEDATFKQPDWLKEAVGSDVGFEVRELTGRSHWQ